MAGEFRGARLKLRLTLEGPLPSHPGVNSHLFPDSCCLAGAGSLGAGKGGVKGVGG